MRAGFTSARRLVAQKFPAILCRANSTHATEDLRKMLLAFEAAGHGYINYSSIGGGQQLFRSLYPLAQDKLMRSLAR